MSKTKRQDFFFNKAKKQGYPARSVYKLKEIDQKFKIAKPGNLVLDLGASPGSWMMYLADKVGLRGRVVGIDLQELKIPLSANMEFIKGDIKDKALLPNIKFDTIVSDLSPKTTGIRVTDAARSLELAQNAVDIARAYLKKEGHLIFKIFDSEDTARFIRRLTPCFRSVKRHYPKAIRKQSREFYVICKHHKA